MTSLLSAHISPLHSLVPRWPLSTSSSLTAESSFPDALVLLILSMRSTLTVSIQHISKLTLTFLFNHVPLPHLLTKLCCLIFSFFPIPFITFWASQVALVIKSPPANARDVRDSGWSPGLGSSPGGEQGNPLQYSCLENPMDTGAW